MERLKHLFLGRSGFHTAEEIKACVRQSKNFDPSQENPDEAEALLLFQTSQQQTWLVATRARLYCILDDIRKSEPHINWAIRRSKLVEEDRVTVPIRTREKEDPTRTALLEIGDHTGWLFSKKLFTDIPVEQRVHDFIARAMIGK